MALDVINLRKLLKILFLDGSGLTGALREDIRDEIKKEKARKDGGGDFYVPFWADAKSYALGGNDLHEMVAKRIAENPARRNLYPQLRDGFLLWWNQRRRWTNAPFEPGKPQCASFPFPGLDAMVKIENFLSVRDGLGAEHYVYPYFAPDPILSDEAARWGLWLLTAALSDVAADDIRILDVIRGKTFALDGTPLQGGEEEAFRTRYAEVLAQRQTLLAEYV